MRHKKWIIISELIDKIADDSTLDNCVKDLSCITYAPQLGYRSYIFKYKSQLVVLSDLGNGHYGFFMPARKSDVIIAKIATWYEEKRYPSEITKARKAYKKANRAKKSA